MKKYFTTFSIIAFMVFLLVTSCGVNNNKSNNDDRNDSTKQEHYKPEKFTEEQEKNDMI